MSFTFVDYAGQKPQGNPFLRDLVSTLSEGYKAGQMPAQMERQRQKEEIANSMQKLLLEEQPEKFKSEMSTAGLARALHNLQINAARRDLDPKQRADYQAQYINALADAYQKGTSGASTNAQSGTQGTSPFSGAGMFPNMGATQGDSQQDQGSIGGALATTQQGAPSMLGGGGLGNDWRQQMFRKAMGLPAQTPQEKFAQQLELYKAKQALAASGEVPTKASITQGQAQLRAIDSLLPMVQRLREFDEPSIYNPNPNDWANYAGMVNPAIDKYIGSYKLPQVQSSINLATDILKKRKGENSGNYHKRLDNLYSELFGQRWLTAKAIGQKSPGTVTIFKDGVPHSIPFDQVEAALLDGGKLGG